MQRLSGRLRSVLALTCLVASGFLLAGCVLTGTELSFEPLAPSSETWNSPYQEQEPKVEILRSIEDAQKFRENFYPPELQEKVLAVDYDSAFVVVVFQGSQPGMGTVYGVEVRRIVERHSTLVVYARFTEPANGVPIAAVPSSPYAVVVVEKPAGLDSDVPVVLKINTVKTRE